MANITAKVEVITPEVAKCYLEHNEGNRILNKGQVAFFAKMMQEGTWQVNGEAIVFDKNGRLVNGQHRLSACLYANVPFETMVIRGVEEETFYTFDTGKARTHGDTFRISGIANANTVSATINAYLLFVRNPNKSADTRIKQSNSSHTYLIKKISTSEILAEYNKNEDYWQYLAQFSDCCYRRCRLLSRSYIGSIVAYLNKAHLYDLEFVTNFVEQIFFEEKTELNAIRMLRQKLVSEALNGGKVKMSANYREQLIIKCWEAYKNNRDLIQLKWSQLCEPERVFE